MGLVWKPLWKVTGAIGESTFFHSSHNFNRLERSRRQVSFKRANLLEGVVLLQPSQKRSFHNRWEGFLGQRLEGHEPIFSVRRHSMMGQSNMTVEMYSNPGEEFQIEGSYSCGCCKVYDVAGECVAQIKKKLDISTNVMLGMDVFTLCLKPRFDAAFAMGLVLVLDHINGVFGADGNDLDPSNLSLAPRLQSKNGDVL